MVLTERGWRCQEFLPTAIGLKVWPSRVVGGASLLYRRLPPWSLVVPMRDDEIGDRRLILEKRGILVKLEA